MHKLISKGYLPFLDIYSKEKPDFLLPFLESKALKRLAWISQSCWADLTKLQKYKFNPSRLDHSLWVALIIWNFTHNEKQTLAWLFHDISHSIFSHVWDFILWDAQKHKSHQNNLLHKW